MICPKCRSSNITTYLYKDIMAAKILTQYKCKDCGYSSDSPNDFFTNYHIKSVDLNGDVVPIVDIHKIINEAMDKKDRYVSISISNGNTQVDIYPWFVTEDNQEGRDAATET